MSVFTPVSEAQARALLEHYTLGELESLAGIAQGVENTNYFLTTTTGEYVLTLFEHIPRADLPFYVGLMDHLARHEVSCPVPMRRDDGEMLTEVCGKPAVIVSKLPGAPLSHSNQDDCRKAGRILGDIHAAAVEYDASLANWRGREWRESFAARVAPNLSRAENELIDAENRFQARHDDTALPQGVIHGDFFLDNVLWDEDGNGGVIDFYFACDDVLLYDVAIAVNDWCSNPDATLDLQRAHAFLDGYRHHRPIEEGERELWPVMLRRAALRTWLGRLGYNHFPRESHMTIEKDHGFSRRLLEHHVAHARALAETLD
ncbi:MAG TPA: homoserine kinase [Usitatibacter sp.]|nr:homoserine kinase [Usitatibacter sp.]